MKKRKVLDAEKSNKPDIIGLGGREFARSVSEKTGADGIIETHINLEPTKNSGFRKQGAGKGDRLRHVDPKRYGENYEKIFGHK